MLAGIAVAATVVAVAVAVVVGRTPADRGRAAPTTRRVPTSGGASPTASAPSPGTPPAAGRSAANTPAATGPPAQPPPSSEQFGVSVNRLFNDGTYTPAQIDAQLRALHQTGATLARGDALWEAAEPTPPVAGVHHYRWEFDDLIAGALAAHGLRWLPIIDYSPAWDQSIPGQDHSPPRSPLDYASFAAAFAARYGRGGSFWSAHPSLSPQPVQTFEIWNEPDNGQFWAPTPDGGRYADLYLEARRAITTTDPGARVIVGGLTAPSTFLPAMLAAAPQLRGQLDGVGVHPYGSPTTVLDKVRADRATLAALGLVTVPLYVTEFGWTTQPAGALNYAPTRVRPQYILSTLETLAHTNCAVAAIVLYTWVTPERNPSDSEDWYGIHAPSGAGTTATAAFADGLRKAAEPAPAIPLCRSG